MTNSSLPPGVRRVRNLFQGRFQINGRRILSPGFDTPDAAAAWITRQQEHHATKSSKRVAA